MSKSKCSIPKCENKFYCKGYCRNHYNSLRRHGDPLQAERNKLARAERGEMTANKIANRVKLESNVGKQCKANGCDNPAKIKGYCLLHDARLKRNGTLETKIKRSNIKVSKCLVIGCNSKPHSHGICKHHLNNIVEFKTPLTPKIVKLCGVKGCRKPHMARGMCSNHYARWRTVVRDYNLSHYVDLAGLWDEDK